MAISPSQQVLLARAYLSKCEWYQHGQSGQAALALARAGLALFRSATGSVGNYIPPAIKLTEAGVEAAKRHANDYIDEAISILDAQKAMGREPK